MQAVAEEKDKLTSQVPEVNAQEPFSTLTIPQRELFGESLLETTRGQRKRRMSATVLSIVFQCFLLSTVLLIPLWFTDSLPQQQLLTMLVAPPPPPPPAPAAPETGSRQVVKVASDIMNGQLRTPSQIPPKVQMVKEDEAPPPIVAAGGVVGGVPGGIPGGQLGGVIGGIISSTSNVAGATSLPKLAVPAVQRMRVSPGVTKGLLAYQIEPTYPVLARQAHIQGAVVLSAIIDKDGNIENLQLVSGHPMLAPAAIDAVRQWRYKPFLLNGRPLEVETTITVTFELRS